MPRLYAIRFTVVTITGFHTTGQSVGSASFTLLPGEHGAAFVGTLLKRSSSTGSIRMSATVAIFSPLNFEAIPAFSTAASGTVQLGAIGDLFPLFPPSGFGRGWQTTLTYASWSTQNVACQTSFFADSGGPLVVSFRAMAAANRTDVLAPGGSVHQQKPDELERRCGHGLGSATMQRSS